MEMKLKQQKLDTYDISETVVLKCEETAEMIVPDSLPDIARITAVCPQILLNRKELYNGRAALGGTIRLSVLYAPEGENGLRTLHLSLPFEAETGEPALSDATAIQVRCHTESAECRALNPRKVFASCRILLDVIAYKKRSLCITEDVEDGNAAETAAKTYTVTLLTGLTEREFTFSDSAELSVGQGKFSEILCTKIDPSVTEVKQTGDKAICRGNFAVSMVVSDGNQNCAMIVKDFPFSQIIDLQGGGDDGIPVVEIAVTDSEVEILSADSDYAEVSINVLCRAFAVCRAEKTVTLLCDLYSTACKTEFQTEPLSLMGEIRSGRVHQSIREKLELGSSVEQILFTNVTCTGITVERSGTESSLRVSAAVQILYQDEGGAYFSVVRTIPLVCPVEIGPGVKLSVLFGKADHVQATAAEDGIDVRASLEFVTEACELLHFSCITSASIDPECKKDHSAAPSLTIRAMRPGETAWDMAKSCCTTVACILDANQLSDERELCAGMLLLIPRKRS